MSSLADSQYLILDSCILEYWLDKDLNQAITKQITEWSHDSSALAVSNISYAELIDGAYKQKIEKVKDLLNKFTGFEVSQRILSTSGILSSIYKLESGRTNGASMEDKIIAATSGVYKSAIITANVEDFPFPFFLTVANANIEYQKKNKKHFLTIAALMPNVKIMNYWYAKLP